MKKFSPVNNHIHVELVAEEDSSGNFQWAKPASDLVAAKVISSSNPHPFYEGDVVIVISTMIQEFEFQKIKYKLCPTSAVVGIIKEE